MTTNYLIRPILTGYQLLDKGLYATFRKGLGTIIEHPVFAFLVEGGGKRVLVDTGMSTTERSLEYHHNGRQEDGQAIHQQLLKIGVEPDSIDAIIFTHLHWDHCANIKEFRKAVYYVGDVEYNFAIDPIPPYWTSYEHPAINLTPAFAGCSFELVHGEKQIFDGITVIPAPGHSPGHIVISVQTVKGSYIIAGDLMFIRENLHPDVERGWPLTPPGRFSSLIETWNSMTEIVKRADYVLMTHDPLQMGIEIFPNDNDHEFKVPKRKE